MNKTYGSILAATALSFGLASYAMSGVIIAYEPWATPGVPQGFSLANEIGASGAALTVPAAFGAPSSPASALNVAADTTGDFGVNVDRISATGGAASQFLGLYNNPRPETLSFDFFQNTQPAGLQYYFVANAATWFYNIDTSGFVNGWNGVDIPMNSGGGWTDLGASAFDFATDLAAGVTEVGFRISYPVNTPGQVFGFDNLQREYRVPEPETYAALSFALICLGITFRRRLQDSMSGALASLKS